MDLESFIATAASSDDELFNDSTNSGKEDDFNLGHLDITTSEDINFDEIDQDLKRFQEDVMVQKSLSRGVDLRQYARETEKELHALTQDSISDYVEQIDEVALLNDDIDICDKTLERMQQMLQTFQSRLGGISDDIKHLQDDSLSMNIKLKNRRAVEGRLQTFLEGIVVPPALVVSICDTDVNEAYVESLKILNDKLKYASSGDDKEQKLIGHHEATNILVAHGKNGKSKKNRASGKGSSKGEEKDTNSTTTTDDNSTPPETFRLGIAARDTTAAQEVLPMLEMMRSKAVAKVRDFLLSRITSLRKGKTNVQMTQQMLLKFRYLYYFLKMHSPGVADEVKSMYISAMSKVLLALFKAYHQQLNKLTVKLDDKKSVFATVPPRSANNNNDNIQSSSGETKIGSMKKKKPTVSNRILGVFEIATRHEILDELDNPPIIMHIAQKESMKYLYEHIFRSVQKHLSDSAANDFTFLVRHSLYLFLLSILYLYV
jgi:vacuolar protein sorting-associated protein 52